MMIGVPYASPQQAWYPAPTPPPVLAPTVAPVAPPLLHMAQSPPLVFAPPSTPAVLPQQYLPQSLPEMLVPTAAPDMQLLLQQQLQVAREYWAQSPPLPLGYGGGGYSPGAGYASPLGAYIPTGVDSSHFGVHGPCFSASAAPTPSMAPKPSRLSAGASEYRPVAQFHQSAVPLSSTPSPIAPSHPSAAQSSSTLSASAKPYRSTAPSQHSVAQSSSAPSSSSNQYGYIATLQALVAQPSSTLSASAKPYRSAARPEPSVAQPAAHVVCLLEKGGEEARLRLLDGVTRGVHSVMESSEGHVVFLALLRACEGRFEELKAIAEAAAASNGEGSLMRVAEQGHGETSLKELMRVVGPYPELCFPLIDCLLRERLMEHRNGAQLLHHLFTTMHYQYCSIIIQFAINSFDELLSSESGMKCLGECFANARNGEFVALEEMVLSRTSPIAKAEHCFCLLQRVLERGSRHLKDRLVERVVEDLVSLSLHQTGRFVVEACFRRMGSPALLQRVLAAFRGLRDDHLALLVQDRSGSYVVHNLLETGKDHFPEETMALARQVEKLPAVDLKEMRAWQAV